MMMWWLIGMAALLLASGLALANRSYGSIIACLLVAVVCGIAIGGQW